MEIRIMQTKRASSHRLLPLRGCVVCDSTAWVWKRIGTSGVQLKETLVLNCCGFNATLVTKAEVTELVDLARPERFELPTYSSGGCRSIQLSYGRVMFSVHRLFRAINFGKSHCTSKSS